jgi:uncharacterized phiE125 gp8 family phage protein
MGRIEFQGLKLQTAATSEPVTLANVKDHLRIRQEDTYQDTYIEGLISVARKQAEDWQHRAYITQTWDLYLNRFPVCDEILLPRPPLQSVTSITYTLDDDSSSTVSSSTYVVDTSSEPGRIILKSGESWPSDTLQVGASVRVRFVAGYGSAGSSVPVEILRAIYMLISHHYENREPHAVIPGLSSIFPVPLGVESLLTNDRFFA